MWFENLFEKKYLGTAKIPTWRTYRKSISQIGYNIERDWVRATMIGINILDEAEQRKKIDAKVENNFKERYYKEYPIIKAFQDEVRGDCRAEKLEEFLKEGVDPNFMIWHDEDVEFNRFLRSLRAEKYPIHFAVQKKNLQAVQLLCEYGAKVNYKDADSLLFTAARNKDCEMLEYLLKKRADVNFRSVAGCEHVLTAIGYQSQEMLSLFIKYGFKENAEDSLLEAAIHFDAVKMIPFLETKLHQSQESNNKALLCAARVGQFEAVRLLLQYKADVNYHSRFCSPLEEALFVDENWKNKEKIIQEKEKIIRLLLSHGAAVNSPDKWHELPFYALFSNANEASFKMARALLDNGARFDLKQLPQIEKELKDWFEKTVKESPEDRQPEILEKMRFLQKRNRQIYAYYLFHKVKEQNADEIMKAAQDENVLKILNDMHLLPLLYMGLNYDCSRKMYDIHIQKIKNLDYALKVKIRQIIRKKHLERIKN